MTVVFDMDGVIFDSERLYIDCWKPVADRHGIPDIEETLYRCLGVNSRETHEIFIARYGEKFPYDEYLREASAIFHERSDNGRMPQKPWAKDILSWLKEMKIKVALASSTKRESVVRELTEGGLIDYFDVLVCGDMVSKSKPDPEIFLKACEELRVKPEFTYAIEDSFNGIRSAHSAGMMPIMVPDIKQPDDEIRGMCTAVCTSLKEVMELFKMLLFDCECRLDRQ